MFKNYSFIVQCNDTPKIKVNVVAESCEKAQEYAKNMYAAQFTTYADDKHNNWSIKEI